MAVVGGLLRTGRGEGGSETPREKGTCRLALIGVGERAGRLLGVLGDIGTAGAESIAVNTDVTALDRTKADKKILLEGGTPIGPGQEGAGPIERAIGGMDVVFIAVGMDDSQSAAAAPEVAELAARAGSTTIGFAIVPSGEEGWTRSAAEGVRALRRAAHTTLVIDETRGGGGSPPSPSGSSSPADAAAASTLNGIIAPLTLPGLINVDLADFRALMSRGGYAAVGTASGDAGADVEGLVDVAVSHPLLDLAPGSVGGAFVNISGGPEMALGEALKGAERVMRLMGEGAMVVTGAQTDPGLAGGRRVTAVLSGVLPLKLVGATLRDHDLFDLEPRSGPDKPMGLEVDLFQLEPRLM